MLDVRYVQGVREKDGFHNPLQPIPRLVIAVRDRQNFNAIQVYKTSADPAKFLTF